MAVTLEDVKGYLGAQPGADAINDEVLSDSLIAAEFRITERCITFDELVAPRPAVIDQAVTMLAARLYRRRWSVSGYEGFGDLGVARVPSLDPDIEDMLTFYLRYDFA